MKYENKIGKNFNNLAQRVLYSYLSTYPRFIPIENAEAGDKSQNQMYEFMQNTMVYIYNNWGILGIAEEADGYYENWQLNNTNPPLIKAMEKIENKFANFIEMLIKIGYTGEIKENNLIILKSKWSIVKSIKEKLQLIGITCEQTKEYTKLSLPQYPLIFWTWKMYSKNDDQNAPKMTRVMSFIHGRYLGKKYRSSDFFGGLIDNKDVLIDLENYLRGNSFDYVNAEPSTQTRYAQVKWTKEYPKDETAFMKVYFNWRKKNQIVFEFKLPQFRILLNSYDKMDENLKDFVFRRLKICDACGYCTQTDKSGKRQKLAVKLVCKNETLNKCPLYPNFTWNYMDKEDLMNIKKLFEFSENKI